MKITEPGYYRLLERWSSRGARSIAHFPAGTVLHVTQISPDYRQVIGPEFEDWAPDEIPAEKIEKP
jgi:hypothetical protein